MSDICQSCRQAPVAVEVTPRGLHEPLRVCGECHGRVLARALRPREWYNLCSVHGNSNEYLSEDYYDETSGRALAPEEAVVDAELLPAPRLADVADSPEELLTYVLTRPRIHSDAIMARRAIEAECLAAMRRQDPGRVPHALSQRLRQTKNPDLAETMLVLCAEVLREAGAGLVREQWGLPTQGVLPGGSPTVFRGLSLATAICLPPEEAYQRLSGALEGMNERERSVWKGILGWLAPPRALDWIEAHASGSIDISWGNLASLSGFDWPRAKKWLASGRPLGLIALDALALCLQRGSGPPLSGKPYPKEPQDPSASHDIYARGCPGGRESLHLPSAAEFVATLEAYAVTDPTPRVQQSLGQLKSFVVNLPERTTE
ncbi:MAG: hypothetical protein AB1486_10150 [Planctomycetota bacterium]